MKHGRPHVLSREDVAFALELESEGVEQALIAQYVFGISLRSYRHAMRVWEAR